MPVTLDVDLVALAEAHRVAVSYRNWRGEHCEVDPSVIVAVLAALDVPASTPELVAEQLAVSRARTDRLPGTLARFEGDRLGPEFTVTLEDGSQAEPEAPLPNGYHLARRGEEVAHLIVSPARLREIEPAWGWALQLYSLHSPDSWGLGDFADLAEFARRAGQEQGAGLLLVNPLDAVSPAHPVERSPYSPASRRFHNPLYLRITALSAFEEAPADVRTAVLALRPRWDPTTELIDYDVAWAAKREALQLLWQHLRPQIPADPALEDFATYCVLAEQHGSDWRAWPQEFHDPAGPAVTAVRAEHRDTIGFHAWLQLLCREQLDAAREAGHRAEMRVGIVHDLPVGTAVGGADTWADRDLFAPDIRVGCPADDFNEQGQDWSLPPWRPDRLAATGYRAFREVVAAALGHGDGIRVDHVAGLWRLWWIPPGEPGHRGTYVHYDAEVMLAILTLEAERAGAIVVGEDLGTVEPQVTAGLHDRGMFSSTVMWFQHDPFRPGQYQAPEHWQRQSMASITTHDLPTAAGWLAEGSSDDVAAMMDLLRDQGLDPGDPILGMHAVLARSASRLVLTSPADVIGETRRQNVPGTIDEHPNWRVPIRPDLDEFFSDPRVTEVIAALRRARP